MLILWTPETDCDFIKKKKSPTHFLKLKNIKQNFLFIGSRDQDLTLSKKSN